jgi:hypothetical protein
MEEKEMKTLTKSKPETLGSPRKKTTRRLYPFISPMMIISSRKKSILLLQTTKIEKRENYSSSPKSIQRHF